MGDSSLTYDDILESLNVRLQQGKLERMTPSNKPIVQPVQNSYIYNKYFKKELLQEQEQKEVKPMTREEYRLFLIRKSHQDAIERERVKQIKSTKLMFHNGSRTDIVIHTPHAGNLNRLFHFHGQK